MWVKVCGLGDAVTLDAAVASGSDAVGFVFASGSPRTVSPAIAAALVQRVPAGVETVGVFRRQAIDEVIDVARAAGVSTVQLHGGEPATDFARLRAHGFRTIRATAATEYLNESADARAEYREDILLIDAPTPGAGRTFDTSALVRTPPARDWVLAGGLDPENVAELIRAAHPWGVDVSSGVESAPGIKDAARIRSFVEAARSVDDRETGRLSRLLERAEVGDVGEAGILHHGHGLTGSIA